MFATQKSARILFTVVMVAFLTVMASSCKSSQYGCPNAITKAEQADRTNG